MINIFTLLTIQQIWGKAWPILLAIAFFGLIIFVHELGHFSCAKWLGVKVNEFAIGMGPKIFSFGKKETKYSLRAFPVGGFVNMEGEDAESDDSRSFNKKPVWRRIVIVVAGAVMNILLGTLIIGIILSQQDLVGTTKVYGFHKDAVSNTSGLKAGDQIISINGMRLYSSFDVTVGLMRDEDGKVDFTVKRDNKIQKLNDVRFKTQKIDGKNVIIYDFILQGKAKTVGGIIKSAFAETLSIARVVWVSLYDLVTGHFAFSELSGPIGTVSVIADTTSRGFQPLLLLMTFITINIGVFNLLPIPALDGGRLFLLIIEGITKKRINPKYEGIINAVGLAVLLLLMAVVSVNDIANLIRR